MLTTKHQHLRSNQRYLLYTSLGLFFYSVAGGGKLDHTMGIVIRWYCQGKNSSIPNPASITCCQKSNLNILKRVNHNRILLYFLGYKTEFLPIQNNPKKLDLSYKTDLDLWDCLGRVKLVLQQNFMGLI